MASSPITKIIPVNGSDDHIAKLHLRNGVSQIVRFTRVDRLWASVSHITERTATGADIAENHKCCCTLPKALTKVGAAGFFANGVQIVFPQDVFKSRDFRAARKFGADPGGFARPGCGRGHRETDRHAGHFFGRSLFDARR